MKNKVYLTLQTQTLTLKQVELSSAALDLLEAHWLRGYEIEGFVTVETLGTPNFIGFTHADCVSVLAQLRAHLACVSIA